MELKLIQDDQYLKPYEYQINNRFNWYKNTLEYITNDFGSIENFANAHHYFGFNYDETNKGYWFRDWLPNAKEVFLIGDFNHWNRTSHPLSKNEYGVWEIFISEISEFKLNAFSK